MFPDYPDEFDLDIRLATVTSVPAMPGLILRPMLEAETDATCYSTCSDQTCQSCDTCETCYSTCSPCASVDAFTCVGDCSNECVGPDAPPTDFNGGAGCVETCEALGCGGSWAGPTCTH